MKIKKFLFILPVFLLVIICFFVVFYISSKSVLNIAFYGIPENVEEAIRTKITDYSISVTKKNRCVFTTLSDNEPLISYLPRKHNYDCIIAYNDKNLQDCANPKFMMPDIIQYVPTALRSSVNYDNPYALPLLLDNFEIAVYTKYLKEQSLSIPASLSAVLDLAQKTSKEADWPIVFSGGSDKDLSFLISSLLLSRYGTQAYSNMIELMKNKIEFDNLLNIPLNEDSQTFKNILDEIRFWESKKYLHPQWIEFQDKEVAYMMSSHSTSIVFLTLSDHRAIDFEVMNLFTDSFFPSGSAAKSRSLIAPVIAIAPLSTKKAGKMSVQTLQSFLIGSEAQAWLGSATGLAPANSTAPAQDKQASNVRLWLAASDKPLPAITDAAFTNKKDKEEFMKQVRNYFLFN